VRKTKDLCHNQSVNGRLHEKIFGTMKSRQVQNLMYSDCGEHCAVGQKYNELLRRKNIILIMADLK